MTPHEHYKQPVKIGMIGHIGHGKTTLTAAIIKVMELKHLAEKKARGVTINIHGIEYKTEKRHYMHVDTSGFSSYIANYMIIATWANGAILVVSAPDGPTTQTREHILLARHMGVPAIVVFLNKIDQVDNPERLELVELELHKLLESYGYSSDTPIVRGSAKLAYESASDDINAPEYQPILQLMDAVDEWIPTPEPVIDKPFLMAIEDVFSIKDRGTVVSGRVERGQASKGEEIEIIGLRDETIKTTLTGIEMVQRERFSTQAGDNVGILLRGITREQIQRGMVLAKPGSITPCRRFMSKVYVLKDEEGGGHKALFSGYRPQFYIRTMDVTGTINLPEGIEMVLPGDNVNLSVELISPVALEKGSKFAIREGGLTVGAGIVTEVLE